MTANYFMLTRGDGLGLDGAEYAPFVRGAGPSTTAVTDNRKRVVLGPNLLINPSIETDTIGWGAVSASKVRSGDQAADGSNSLAVTKTGSAGSIIVNSTSMACIAGNDYLA